MFPSSTSIATPVTRLNTLRKRFHIFVPDFSTRYNKFIKEYNNLIIPKIHWITTGKTSISRQQPRRTAPRTPRRESSGVRQWKRLELQREPQASPADSTQSCAFSADYGLGNDRLQFAIFTRPNSCERTTFAPLRPAQRAKPSNT